MIPTLALVAAALLNVAAAHAAGVEDDVVLNVVTEEAVRAAVTDFVQDQVADIAFEASERLEINPRWQGDVLLERGGKVDLRVHRMSSRALRGPTMLRVELVVNGETRKALTVTTDVRFHRPVVVTTRSIRRGSMFAEDGSLELTERDVTSARHGYFTDISELMGLRARRPIGFDDVVSHRHAEELPVVNRGDNVEMRIKSSTMQMSTVGVALQDGALGNLIRVKNVTSGKVLFGKVLDASTVQLGEGA